MTQYIFDDASSKLAANMGATRPGNCDVYAMNDLAGSHITTPNFDIRIENELLRVTAISVDGGGSGIDRYTVSHLGGAAAGTHAAGQEVEQIITGSGISQMISDSVGAISDDDSAYAPLAGATFTGDVEFEGQIIDATEAAGTDGQVLTKVSGNPQWATPSSGFANPMTTKGDIIYEDGTPAPARLALSATDGDVLTVNHTTGLPEWRAAAGGGSGASTADAFVVGAHGSDLSADIVIPGLQGVADIKAGGGSDDEFDQNSAGTPTGWTSFGSPDTVDTNSFKSYLRLKTASNGGSHSLKGVLKAAPSLAFTVTAKLHDVAIGGPFSNYGFAGIGILDGSSTGKALIVSLGVNGGVKVFVDQWTNWTSDSSETGYQSIAGPQAPLYLRLVAHAANNIDVMTSFNGMAWVTLASGINFLASADRVALALDAYSQTVEAYFDWIRFS
jgi:hypothetical protein